MQSEESPAARGRLESEIVARTISALALATIALMAAVFGGWPAAILLAAFAAAILWEWIGITERQRWPGLVWIAAPAAVLAAWMAGYQVEALVLALVAIAAAAIVGGWPWRPVGVVYALAFALALLVLRQSTGDGLVAILFVFAVVWATDTAAYVGGRAIGGPPLWVAISPKKTRAGAISGLVGGTAAGVIVLVIADLPVGVAGVLTAAALSIIAQIGDLFESWIKRRFDRKDSGRLIPGHGGVMDRVDGLTFAAGAAAIVGAMRDPLAPATGLLLW